MSKWSLAAMSLPEPNTAAWSLPQLLLISIAFGSISMQQVFFRFPHFYYMSASMYVAYYAVLFVICLPIIYIQLRLGGKFGQGIVGVLSSCIPIFKGAGVAVLITTFINSLIETYYASTFIYYAFQGLYASPFPWSGSDPGPLYKSEEDYLWNGVREATDGIEFPGSISWWLPTCNVAVWGIIFLGICAGLRYVGYVLALLGSVALTLTICLLAYGREQFVHSGKPEGVFYKAVWDSNLGSVENFLQNWLPALNSPIIIAAVFFGSHPTIGKCLGQKTTVTHLSWIPIILMMALLPHLFVNLIAPYLEVVADKLGETEAMLLLKPGRTLDFFFYLIPRILSTLEATRGVAFMWFFTLFLFILMGQILHATVVVDNLAEWLYGMKCFGHRPLLFLLMAFFYCATAFVLSLPMITQGGYYVVYLVSTWLHKSYGFIVFALMLALIISYGRQRSVNRTCRMLFVLWTSIAGVLSAGMLIYEARFDQESSTFTMDERSGSLTVYPYWAYIVGWLICVGPIGFGLLIGACHSCCCSANENSCLGAQFDEEPEDDDTERSSRSTQRLARKSRKPQPRISYIDTGRSRKYSLA